MQKIFLLVMLICVILTGAVFAQVTKDTTGYFSFDSSTLNKNEAGDLMELTLAPSAIVYNDGVNKGKALRLFQRKSNTDLRSFINYNADKFGSGAFSIDFYGMTISESPVPTRGYYFLSSPNMYFRYSVDKHSYEFGVQTDAGWFGVATSKSVFSPEFNKWYRFTGVYDGSEIRFYIDEKLIGKTLVTGKFNMQSIILGSIGWATDASEDLDGAIDNLEFTNLIKSFSQKEKTSEVAKVTEETKKYTNMTPSLVIPKTSVAPKIDGNPNDSAWNKATWVGNPVYLNASEITSKIDVNTGIMYDDEALYVAFKVFGFRKPNITSPPDSKGDDGLERDDAVEVTLFIPRFKNGSATQFKLNCVGMRDDAIGFDFSWNGEWEGKTTQDGNNWYATFKLPFKNFGVSPKSGDEWFGNFGAYLVGYDYRAFLWTPVAMGHHHVGEHGKLTFGDTNTVASQINKIKVDVNTIVASGFVAGESNVRVLLFPKENAKEKDTMIGGYLIGSFDEEAKLAIAQKSVKLKETGNFNIDLDNVSSGDYLLKIIIFDKNNKPVNVDVKPVKIEKSIESQVLRYPVAKSATAKVTVHDMGNTNASVDKLFVTLTDSKGKIVYNKTLTEVKLKEKYAFEFKNLVNKETYKLKIKAFGKDNNIIEENSSFTLQEMPFWANNKIGISSDVPKPWTPTVLKGTSISVLGRTYTFGNSILPESIVTQKVNAFSEPAKFIVKSGDKEIVANQLVAPMKFVNQNNKVTFNGVAKSDFCDISMKGYIQYDGFTKLGFEVLPRKLIDGLVLEFVLPDEFAKFLYPMPAVKNKDRCGSIPKEGYAMDKNYNLFISNPDTGLYITCDSYENWEAPKDKGIIFEKRDGKTYVKLNLYEADKGFKDKRVYNFFIEATPTKNFNDDIYKNGLVMNGLVYGHNVQALENDVVKTIPIGVTKTGSLDITIQNTNDLASFKKSDGVFSDHWCMNENILKINSKNTATLQLSWIKVGAKLALTTPWGAIGLEDSANWKPNEVHKVSIKWGEKLELYLDGKKQGELLVNGLPLEDLKLELGSISARYILKDIDLVCDNKEVYKSVEALNLRSNARTPLTEAKEMGVGTLIFFENWCTAQNGGVSKNEPYLKNVVEDCHKAGLKVIFYFGFEIADVPEHKDMIEECKGVEDQSANYYSPAQMNTYWVSYGGPYQEYIIYNMKRLKEEVGIDGVYLDGSLFMGESDNRAFGCGYDTKNGTREKTVPVERVKSFAERINNLFMQDGGVVFAHLFASPVTQGFVTYSYAGEHVGFLNVPWNKVADVIPYDVSQALYSGKNTGSPMILCLQNMWPHLRSLRPKWYESASSWGDLHRVGINTILEIPIAKEGVEEITKQKLVSEFGILDSTWTPYWEASKFLGKDDIKISYYTRKSDGALLLMVANDTDSDFNGSIDISKLPNVLLNKPARDLITGDKIEYSNGVINIIIPYLEHKIVVIGDEKSASVGK